MTILNLINNPAISHTLKLRLNYVQLTKIYSKDLDYKILVNLLLNNTIPINLPAIIALLMLTSAPFFLLQNEKVIANQTQNTDYGFYFLVVSILWSIIQYFMNKQIKKNNISPKKVEI
jgi:hypothetical protein